jgi:hypothetical protein
MGTNSTGSKSVRKNRRVRKPAKPTPIGMIGVKVEVVEATHDLLKRLAYDVDSQFTGDEIEKLARAFFEVIDRGPGFGPEFIGEVRDQLVEAVEQSVDGKVVVPLAVMRRLSMTLDRLADHRGHLSEPLVRACEERLRRTEFDEAVAAALAARDLASAVPAIVAQPVRAPIAASAPIPCACETEAPAASEAR